MNSILTAKEVAEMLKISDAKAYQIIRELNEELKEKGYYTIRGKVSSKYLNERIFGNNEEVENARMDN